MKKKVKKYSVGGSTDPGPKKSPSNPKKYSKSPSNKNLDRYMQDIRTTPIDTVSRTQRLMFKRGGTIGKSKRK